MAVKRFPSVRIKSARATLLRLHMDGLIAWVVAVLRTGGDSDGAQAREAIAVIEARPGFRTAPFGKLLTALQLSPAAAWALRLAAGYRFAVLQGEKLRPLTRGTIASAVPDLSLAEFPESLGAAWEHGILVSDGSQVPELSLAPGVEAWLAGIVWPERAPNAPPWLVAGGGVERFGVAVDLRAAMTYASVVVMRGKQPALALAASEATSRASKRRLVVARNLDDAAFGAAAFIVGLEGEDLFVTARGTPRAEIPRTAAGPCRLFVFAPQQPPNWPRAMVVDFAGVVPFAASAARDHLAAKGMADRVSGDVAVLEQALRLEEIAPAAVRAAPPPGSPLAGFMPPALLPRPLPEALDELVLDDALASALRELALRFAAGGRTVVLLHGPSGTGKTHAARALAAASGRPLAPLDAATIRGRHVGESEANIRAAFTNARQRGAVVFIDEAEGWLPIREALPPADHRVVEVGGLLTAFDAHDGPIVLATNLPRSLDPAARRRVDVDLAMGAPGPFERMVLWTRALGAADDSTVEGLDLFVLCAVPANATEIVRIAQEVLRTGPRTTRALFERARALVENR